MLLLRHDWAPFWSACVWEVARDPSAPAGTAAWLPWLLLAIGRALAGYRYQRRNALLATLCWTLVFVSGFAQTALCVYGIALSWGLMLTLSRPREQRRTALLTLLRIVGEHAEIRSQLAPGTPVVALGVQLLQPGQAVRVRAP